MRASPPGTLGVARRLARLSLRRRMHRLALLTRRRKGKGRAAVGRSRSGLSPFLWFFGVLMVFQAFILGIGILHAHVAGIERDHVEPSEVEIALEDDPELQKVFRDARLPDWPAPEREHVLFASLSIVLTLAFLAMFFLHLSTGNPDLSQAGWDMEWLFTFPVPSRGLFLAKIGEFVFGDLIGWVVLPAFLIPVLWRAGYGGWAIPLGVLGAFGMLIVLAAFRLVAETWMRKRLSVGALKNVQAMATVLGMVLFFLGFLAGIHPPAWLFDVAGRLSAAVAFLPWTAGLGLGVSSLAVVVLAAWALLFALGALGVSSALVKDGLLVSGGSVYGGSRAPRAGGAERKRRLRGLLGKEIRLLLRDRNLMVQMLVMPLLIVGFQLAVNPGVRAVGMSPRAVVVAAYGVGAYVLMFGAFAVLFVERRALWLLFTFPQRLGTLLRQKVALWAGVALLYAVGVLALAWRPEAPFEAATFLVPPLALLGIPVFASIAAGLGALGTDPFEQDDRRRVSPQWIYLYLLLAGSYGYALGAADPWSIFVLLVLMTCLSWAVWQKADERLPLLLDPVALPERRLSLPDGLIAALAFFVLQGVLVLPLVRWLPIPVAILLAYVLAGALVAVGVALTLRRSGAWRASLSTLGLGAGVPPRALLQGALAGGAAAVVALGWSRILEAVPALREARDAMPVLGADLGAHRWAIVLLAVVAAPLVEELLFRGMLLGGLRARFSPAASVVAAALVFAVVHPPIGAPAVFALGLAAGWVFVRTGVLWAAIAAHAVYNLAVVVFSS